MGVKGLLPCLQSITRTVPLERYRGLTAAVDAMSWLHKGIFACDVKTLAHSQRNNPDRCCSTESRCVKYAMDKAQILRAEFGIQVLLVIDGDALPSKKEENAHRREDRENAFEKALAAEKAGDSRAARRFYAMSCSVTHQIRYLLIQACKQDRIQYLVAPYEADAQMARLAHTGVVDLVITEDSDILAYGCPRALFKISFDSYDGQEIQLMRDLGLCKDLSFTNWTHDMFVFMCILSGCDYSKGVSGIGIKLAHKLVRVHRSPSKIFNVLRAAGRVPRHFEDEFWVAFRTFRHQRVFCSSKQQIEPLFPIPASNYDSNPMEMWPFLGEYISPHIAARIADGTFHPSKKVEWEMALGRSTNTNALQSARDIQIHHRSPPRKQRRKESESREKHNVWHALVYGNDESRHGSRHIENKDERSCTQKAPSNMFRFFSDSNPEHALQKKQRDSTESSDSRPPLAEIYVGENVNNPKQPPPPGHKDLPIHFHEYKSHLVGNKFKPISRKRGKRDNDGTKSTEVVQRIWNRSREQAPPVRKNCNVNIEKCRGNDENEDSGIPLFSRENNPIASAPMHQLSNEDCEQRYLLDSGIARPSYSFQAHHPDRRNHQSSCDYPSYVTQTCERPYTQLSPKRHTVKPSMPVHHHDHYDYEGCRTNHDAHYHLENRIDAYDEDSQFKPYHVPNDSRPNDQQSLTSGYTTVEPESCKTGSTGFEYPAFPSELRENVHDNRQVYDFEDSLHGVLAVDTDRDNDVDRTKCSKEYANDDEYLGVFQIFQNKEKHCMKSHAGYEYVPDKNTLVSLERELSAATRSRSRDNLYDNGLLMAFEEMQQL